MSEEIGGDKDVLTPLVNREAVNLNILKEISNDKNQNLLSPKAKISQKGNHKKNNKKLKDTKELPYEEKKQLVAEILGISSTCIITMVSHFLIMTVSLIFLGHQDPTLFQLNATQIAICYFYTFGVNFAMGSMYAFDSLGMKAFEKNDSDSLDKFYNKGKIFCALTFLMIILPFNFNADYILYFFGIDDPTSILAGKVCKICLISIFFSMLAQLNLKMLHILKQQRTVMFINIFVLSLHIVSCMTFVVAFDLGAIGVAISLSISSFASYCVSNHYIDVHTENEENSLFQIDMGAINSTKFYHYVVVGVKNGAFSAVKNFSYNLIVFSAYYLDQTSLAASAILYDYSNILYTVAVGICLSMNDDFHNYLLDIKNSKIEFKIKSQMVLALIVCGIMALLNFLFHNTISFIYVENADVAVKFAHIVKLYSFFIIFDWANNISLSFIKNISKHTHMHYLHSLVNLTIFVPLGLLLAFVYHCDYAGMWYSIFMATVIFASFNVYYIFNLDIAKESQIIQMKMLKNKEDE